MVDPEDISQTQIREVVNEGVLEIGQRMGFANEMLTIHYFDDVRLTKVVGFAIVTFLAEMMNHPDVDVRLKNVGPAKRIPQVQMSQMDVLWLDLAVNYHVRLKKVVEKDIPRNRVRQVDAFEPGMLRICQRESRWKNWQFLENAGFDEVERVANVLRMMRKKGQLFRRSDRCHPERVGQPDDNLYRFVAMAVSEVVVVDCGGVVLH